MSAAESLPKSALLEAVQVQMALRYERLEMHFIKK
jgi:hypothetical protein